MCSGQPREKQSGFSAMLCVFNKNKGIRGQLCSRLTTVSFISSVLTVVLLIAGPAHGNAATTRTSKEVDRTFKLPFICETKDTHTIKT